MRSQRVLWFPAAITRFAHIGAVPEDDPDEALRKRTLVLSAGLITLLATVWVATYWALGLYASALIPLTYQVVSIVNLVVFARTKRYRVFRMCELTLSLLLPVLLQISLGGFVPSSGIILWSFTAPLGALLFAGRRQAIDWGIAFLVLVALAGVLDPFLANKTDQIPNGIVVTFFVLNIVGVTGTCYVLLHYFVGERDKAAAMIAAERERSERLLLNVLPESVAERLKAGEREIADGMDDVGVLFADIAGFTPISAAMSPHETVRLLDRVFTVFDRIAEHHGLEKIKTIGDAYMAASGLLVYEPDHAEKLARAALAMRDEAREVEVKLRVGIDIGPVVAGVIGRSKFIYDLWGDTVNTASRMESHGIAGEIQVTERVYLRLSDAFAFRERGSVDVKGKGPMRTYLLVGPRVRATAGS
ncbi:MAG: adenylate/guanylate cyclase domain-containing protein [Actinomycetota bacterium]